jgi:hypothetical protein
MPDKALILDANILVRAVLGSRVRQLLETHCEDILFLVPDTAYREAVENLPGLTNYQTSWRPR